MSSRAHKPPHSQTSFDWLLGPTQKVFQVNHLRPVLGLDRNSIIALLEAGELWGHDHPKLRGTGRYTKRTATRDGVLCYLAKTATGDDATKLQRLAEAIATIHDQEQLLRLRAHIDQLLSR